MNGLTFMGVFQELSMNRYNPDIHHRHSLRLQGYDYSEAGAYFVTVCTKDRECLLGNIVDGEIVLNDAGRMVQSTWEKLSQHNEGVETDEFVVMPNHFHGIIMIGVGADPRVCPEKEKIYPPAAGLRFFVGAGSPCPHPDGTTQKGAVTAPLRRSLGQAVAYFKYQSTKSINQFYGTLGLRLWQRNYYEHIIRNEEEMNGIREYIMNNPAQWSFDSENPEREEKDVPATAGLRFYVGAGLALPK